MHWRDVQHLLVETAVKNDPQDVQWKKNAAGKLFNLKYGFGVVNADLLINKSTTFRSLPRAGNRQVELALTTPIAIKPGSGQSILVEVPALNTTSSQNIQSLEHFELFMDIEHGTRRSLEISVQSPQGTNVLLMVGREKDSITSGIKDWTFMTVFFWGENPTGKWTITINDKRNSGGAPGLLRKLKVILHGISCQTSEWKLNNDGGYICPWEETEYPTEKHSSFLLIFTGIAVTSMLVIGALFYWYKKVHVQGTASPAPKQMTRSISLKEILLVDDPNNEDENGDLVTNQSTTPSGMRKSRSRNSLAALSLNTNSRVSNSKNLPNLDVGQLPSPVRLNPLASPLPGPARNARPFRSLDLGSMGYSRNNDDLELQSPKSPDSKKRYFEMIRSKFRR